MTSALPTGRQINLQLGWPSPSLFPAADLNASANAVLQDFSAATAALVYGPSRGHAPLRKEVARWLGSTYRKDPEAIDETRVCIAGGASQNLSNILLRFADPTYTGRVWMVEPTYFLACPIIEDCGFAGKMRGVPEDDEGIDLDFLRAGLKEVEAECADESSADGQPRLKTGGYEKIYRHVIYVVPTFSNPSGKTMSLRRRRDLVKLAIEHDALIVSDDVYDFLYWPAQGNTATTAVERKTLVLPPRLVDINRQLDPDSKWGNTVSNGSFSKIVGPGLRVSWAEATPAFAAFLAATGASISGGNPGHLASTFVERLLSSGALQRHIEGTLVPTYASRYRAMVGAVERHLVPLGVRITMGKPYAAAAEDDSSTESGSTTTAGGFFLLITLPEGAPAAGVLAKHALDKHELKFAHGRMFEVKGDPGSRLRCEAGYGRTIRLCWAFHEEGAIVEGVERLATALTELS